MKALPLRLRRGGADESGLTLIELMISMALGLMVVGAATALLVSAKSGYLAQDDEALLGDSGRYALEAISRAVREAAYENWDAAEAPVLADAVDTPSVTGLDASRLGGSTAGIDGASPSTVNGSDVLAIRFFGSSDGAMMNCAGFSVPPPASEANAESSRGWSIFYVAEDAAGIPQLYCKYQGKTAWSSEAMVQGVESFQVLYGLDSDGDGLPNRYVTATQLNAMDAALSLTGTSAQQLAQDRNRKTNWKKVVAVQVALLVRGSHRGRSDSGNTVYDLFGDDYSDANAADDAGTRIAESAMPASLRNRARKMFRATIQLRNQPSGAFS